MNRLAFRSGLAILTPAVAGMCAWSIYTVAHDRYGVPGPLAVGAGLVFDGTAMCNLALATDAVRDGRSAAGPIGATAFLAGISVYLNHSHAQLYGWGMPATVLFAMPTVALLLVMLFALAPARAKARKQRGESPMRPPTLGGWTWLLAPWPAVVALQSRASEHVKAAAAAAGDVALPDADAPRRTAHQLLVEKFSRLDPVDVITLLADAHPALSAAELAEMACHYGTTVDATHVALVLAGERITVQRAAAGPAVLAQSAASSPAPRQLPAPGNQAPPASAPQGASAVQGPAAPGSALVKADLVRSTVAALGAGVTAKQIAEAVTERHQLPTDAAYVRTVLSRDRKAAAAAEAAAEAREGAKQQRRATDGGYL